MKTARVASLLLVTLAAAGQTSVQGTMHAPDGGTFTRIQSISVLPLTNASFSATVTTQWTRILPDSTTASLKNHRTIARDSTGRIFEERRSFTQDGDTQSTRLDALQYSDPNRHEYFNCVPTQKTCYQSTYGRPAMSAMPAGMDGLRLCGCASESGQGITVQREALGQKTIENLEVIGSREITTLPAGIFGNTRPQPIVKEFWYSARLGLNLITQRFDPRSGSQNFLVSHVSLNEPDPRMFEPPADYRIVREMVVKEASTPGAH